ncbi:MAG: glycoside hydrolase family 18 protein [Chitinophagaceae bacterium]|nr:MAG: glycoside hydrolase family 18 protein [Chitinophagaceae bacterium]
MRLLQFSLLFFILLLVQSCPKKSSTEIKEPTKPNIIAPPKLGFSVVGYFPSYRTVKEYDDVFFKRCTIINYAFSNVNTAGTLDAVNQLKFDSVYNKAKANGAKVFMSVVGADNFKAMATTAVGRNNFIKSVLQKVRQYKLDGVDIDWEYPKTSDGSDISFAALMKELSDSLHVDGKYYLSAAITPGKYAGSIRDGIKNEVFNYTDFFNVMIYDDFNTTVPYKHHSDMSFYDLCLNYWINTRGMPKEKFIAGIPLYGRPSGITQSGTVLSYKTILALGGNPVSDSAVVSAGGFNNYTIYYNGQNTVKNKAIKAQQNANGIMFWEIGQDDPGTNSLIKAACDAIGRVY